MNACVMHNNVYHLIEIVNSDSPPLYKYTKTVLKINANLCLINYALVEPPFPHPWPVSPITWNRETDL